MSATLPSPRAWEDFCGAQLSTECAALGGFPRLHKIKFVCGYNADLESTVAAPNLALSVRRKGNRRRLCSSKNSFTMHGDLGCIVVLFSNITYVRGTRKPHSVWRKVPHWHVVSAPCTPVSSFPRAERIICRPHKKTKRASSTQTRVPEIASWRLRSAFCFGYDAPAATWAGKSRHAATDFQLTSTTQDIHESYVSSRSTSRVPSTINYIVATFANNDPSRHNAAIIMTD